MVETLAWAVGGILFGVSGIHLYWATGGRWGAQAAIPSIDSKPLFRPTKAATLFVAAAMAAAGWLVLELGGALGTDVFTERLLTIGGWLLAGVFLIRSVGDFTWLGFFKRRRGTVFAKWDTRLYSPLCLVLGVSLLYLTLQ